MQHVECPTSARAAELRAAVREKYSAVSREAERGNFAYPVGTQSIARLGYHSEWFADVPSSIAERFVGVGNPFGVRPARKGERVLDVGCGCGFDTFVTAGLIGPGGLAVGLDLTPEMLEIARTALAQTKINNLQFREGQAEALPFDDASFDLVISNGVLNLVPDKDVAFKEIVRVLRPGGDFVAADLVVVESIPAHLLASMDAWST